MHVKKRVVEICGENCVCVIVVLWPVAVVYAVIVFRDIITHLKLLSEYEDHRTNN